MPVIPQEFTLLRNQEKRLLPTQLGLFVPALLEEDHPHHLAIRYKSKVCGPPHRQWVEVRATNLKGSYTLVFGLKDRSVVQLWMVITPSGAAYDIDKDGGNPLSLYPTETLHKLTALLDLKEEGAEVVVTPYWKIELKESGRRCGVGPMYDKGSAGPKGLSFPRCLAAYNVLFESEEEASKVARELKDYFADQKEKTQKVKTKEAKKK
jgi:hypothetical protein